DTRAAMARMAMRPIQSHRLETHCAVHSRKNVLLPNTRHGASGMGGSEESEGNNDASRRDCCTSSIRTYDPGADPGAGGVVVCSVARLAGVFFAGVFFAGVFLAAAFVAVA